MWSARACVMARVRVLAECATVGLEWHSAHSDDSRVIIGSKRARTLGLSLAQQTGLYSNTLPGTFISPRPPPRQRSTQRVHIL